MKKLKTRKLFTKDFMLALAIALALHLTAFGLFRIDLGQILAPSFESKESKPSLVFSDRQGAAMSIELDPTDPAKVPDYLIVKRLSISDRPSFFPSFPFKGTASSSVSLPDYEIDSYRGPCLATVHLSGGAFEPIQALELTSLKPCKGTLAFRAWMKTGQIFWLDWIESTGNRQLDSKLEEKLKAIPITPSNPTPHLMIASGIVEVEFSP